MGMNNYLTGYKEPILNRNRLFMLLMLALLAWPMAAAAQTDTLISLAERYPAETVIFGAWRVDDATIDAFNDIALEFADRVTGIEREDTNVWDNLDEAANDFQAGATYESLIGAWLGDTAAVGLFLTPEVIAEMDANDGDVEDLPLVWAIDITDQSAASDFVAAVILDSGEVAVPSDENGYTVYNFAEMPYIIAVGADVALGGHPDYVAQMMSGDFGASLADSATFNDTLALLPNSDYSGMFFADQQRILEIVDASGVEDLALADAFGRFTSAQAGGYTAMDDRTLAIDLVQAPTPERIHIGAITPDFVQRLPMTAPLVLHSTNLLGVYESVKTNAEAMTAAGIEDEMGDVTVDEVAAEFTELTGLDLEADVLSWMTGDYAVFLDIRKELADATNMFAALVELPVEFGVVIDSSADPDSANAVIDAIEALLEKQATELAADEFNTTELALAREEIGRVNALVITLTDTAGNIPFPIELIIAANDEVFAFGTRNSVNGMLLNDGGLNADPVYADAMANAFVESPTGTATISFPSLLRLVNLVNSATDEQTSIVVRDALSLFTHWTVSAGTNEDGTSFARLSITFSEAE